MTNEKVIRIHNPTMALPDFSFHGIENYSTRSMTNCEGITIVSDCGDVSSLLMAHNYYRSIGLGPDKLVLAKTPPNGDLYETIFEDKTLRSQITQLVREEGYKIEFFCTREGIEEKFIHKLGLAWSDVISHPSALSDTWNNKSTLRKIARVHHLGGLFPLHQIVYSAEELKDAVRNMLKTNEEIVIKRPLWASGVGMTFGCDMSVVEQYISQHKGVPPGTIVEQSLGTEHTAMSVVTRFETSQITDRWFTEQECPLQNGAITHDGSILGGTPKVTSLDTKWMEETTALLYELIARDYQKITGVINFDCARGKNGQRFILECNARITFSTYIQEIRRKILAARRIRYKHHKAKATCLVRKAILESIKNFESLTLALGQTLLTNLKHPGVIPIVPGCLPHGYCYLVAVGDSYAEANQLMNDAKTRITSLS